MSRVEGEGVRGRTLSLEEAERIRESVERGVERVVKPFVKRVEEQSKIPNKEIRIRSAA